MTDGSPLYLGFDLSTQQLKGIAITSNLKVAYEAVFDFDADATSFGIKKGVLTNEVEREVYAPVLMWLQAVDSVLRRLQVKGIDFGKVGGISGAGQPFHGSLDLALPIKAPRRIRKDLSHFLGVLLSCLDLPWKDSSIDIADVCGMNLFDIKTGSYNQKLMALAAGSSITSDLESKLGHVPEDGGANLGVISQYFVRRYGFSASCTIAPFTGDNPSTILALPLRPLDAIVSLGTSTTFLMSTPHYKPDPAVHFMNHPTTPGLYMFMLCYKNGGLAREHIRDALPSKSPSSSDQWSHFNHHAMHTHPLGVSIESSAARIGLYFPRPEIVPNVKAGTYGYIYTGQQLTVCCPSAWKIPEDDCRAIIESQLLSLRLRSRGIVAPPSPNPRNIPAQPRRVYLVGGGSQNAAIAKLAGEILGGVEGVYRLDVGGNACALGSAYKAVWAVERKLGETFEDFIGSRWREDEFVEKIADGYQEEIYRSYEKGVDGLEAVEKDVLKKQTIDVDEASTTGASQE